MKRALMFWILLTAGMTMGILVEVTFGAQRNGKISGHVIDATTGEAIADASIDITPGNRQTSTGVDGWYILEEVPAGLYSVTVSHPQYEARSFSNIRVSEKQPALVDASLQRKAQLRDDNYKSRSTETLDRDKKSTTPEMRQEAEAGASGSQNAVKVPLQSQMDSYAPSHPKAVAPYPGQSYLPPVYYPVPGDMIFRDYGTNDFVEALRDRFSTFGLDVDDASYTLARSYLNDGHLPPAEAIRMEEFINHFSYGYAEPERGKFRIFTEITSSPFDRRTNLLKIGIKGKEIHDYQRKPLNLTLVIDVSGSMQWGNRLELVKESIRMLVEQLDRQDQVGIVAYGSNAFVVLQPTPASRKKVIISALDRLHPGGSTFAEAGLRLGYEMANEQFIAGHNNVVALCSDGVANVGKTSPEAIMRDIKRFTNKGIALSTFGFGMGNYNDALLEQLAQQGNGKYAYVDQREQARKLFVDELVSTVQVLAWDAKVQVEFDPEVVQSYRLVGFENRAIADHKFRDNRQDGGEVGAGHEVTALYEVVLTSRHWADHVATVFVRWKDTDRGKVTEVSRKVSLGGDYTKRFESSRPELRLAIVSARFAELLKGTEHAWQTGYDELYRMARDIERQMPNEETRELVQLIDRARMLSVYHSDYRYKD